MEIKENSLQQKLQALKEYITGLGALAVGFSGGVDSSLLLAVAAETLGEKALAITAESPFNPLREMEEAKAFCKKRGIRHVILKADPLENDIIRSNPPDRCYHCKKMIFSGIKEAAKENGIKYIAEGSNMDDMGDYRPGFKAVEEMHIVSPLRKAGLYKAEIRELARIMGLETWDKPAYACLATRIAYGEEITAEKLRMIELAESGLMSQGFPICRVRLHGSIARVEVPEKDIARFADDSLRTEMYEYLKSLGFTYITLDMKGFSSGSMNMVLNNKKGL
ncbi:MAG: ATP-dependent sacrificial sulfur transferase LarE [Lachnospiraceae bacterium]|nr:ATP-dependent sacrificial sulfur transferase LarE [Lachnospiraceae bacterium]